MPHSSPLLPVATFSLLLLLTLSPLAVALAAAGDAAYDALRQNGLPMGLLPKGVKSFQIDADGNFEAELDAPCTARFESDVRYEATIGGTISYAQIKSLRGVSAQELFLWFPVKGIRVDVPSSGVIYFDVGVIYKQYSVSLFETPPDCHAAPDTTAIVDGRRASQDDADMASTEGSAATTPENVLSLRVPRPAKRNTAL